jgi:Flp pilus assembly protein TadG
VEFALVMVPLFILLYGLISFGMVLALKQSVTSAAAEGARSVVGVIDNPATPPDERLVKAKATVTDRLNWLGGNYDENDVQVSWYEPNANPLIRGTCNYAAPPATPASPATVCVKITYPYSSRPLVPPPPIISEVMPSTVGSEARVQVG